MCDNFSALLGTQEVGTFTKEQIMHSPSQLLAPILAEIAAGRAIKFDPGSQITASMLATIAESAPKGPDGRPRLPAVSATGVTLESGAGFRDCIFGAAVDFTDSTFDSFHLIGCTFEADVDFSNAAFSELDISSSEFRSATNFIDIQCSGKVAIRSNTWNASASFRGAQFAAATEFADNEIAGDCNFAGTIWEDIRRIGPILADRNVTFESAHFGSPIALNISANMIDFTATIIAKGGVVAVKAKSLDLTDVVFGAPTTLVGEERSVGAGMPLVVNAGRANFSNLSLNCVDLSEVRLESVLELDKARINSSVFFSEAPIGRTRRRVIADERIWRSSRRWTWGWRAPAAANPPITKSTSGIASTYRSLRKSYEDARNEPGAADFYYGEMEMRRFARRQRAGCKGAVERLIIRLYWLLAGYGTRAWRCIAALLLLLVVSSVAMSVGGFDQTPPPPTLIEHIALDGTVTYKQPAKPDTSLTNGIRFSIEAATSLLRPVAPARLTDMGRAIEIVLRFLGPALLALSVLCIRARVRR